MLRVLYLLPLLAAGAPALAQSPAPTQPPAASVDQSPAIIVTGRRLEEFRRRLAECIARHCPVNEDVDATMAVAEVEFESGDYEESRRTVAASLGRNRDQARAFPEPVADLFRARSRIARHLGRDDEAVRSTYDVLRTLDAGIPQEDYRHFTARLEIAEMMLVAGRTEAAREQLATLAEHARAANRPDVAALAELRSTWLAYLMAPGGPALHRLEALADDTSPDHRMLATGAKVLLARAYRDQGNRARSDALIAEVARANPQRRNLVFSPPYVLASRETTEEGGVSMVNTRIPDVVDGQWVDVGFWVGGDGHVQDLEVVRSRGRPDWADPLLRSIRGRIYTASADGGPTYRLERYTYTAPLVSATGTRILQHSPAARVEYYDLSTGEPPPEDAVARHAPSAGAPAQRPSG